MLGTSQPCLRSGGDGAPLLPLISGGHFICPQKIGSFGDKIGFFLSFGFCFIILKEVSYFQ